MSMRNASLRDSLARFESRIISGGALGDLHVVDSDFSEVADDYESAFL
ncbi:MAG: hypothetical protein IJU26_00220 [Synergistaceae bacterium]|nr:hypothetical protein [Synergistaceae bacterium]